MLLALAIFTTLVHAEPAPPRWLNQIAARVEFNFRHDQRQGKDREIYSINERGDIYGSEFARTIRTPGDRETFVNFALAQGRVQSRKEAERLFDSTLEKETLKAWGVLALNRVLDQEAMKRKYSPFVTEDRLNYVLRTILLKHGMNSGLIPTHLESDLDARGRPVLNDQGEVKSRRVMNSGGKVYSNQELYTALLGASSGQAVHIAMDWEFNEGNTYSLLEAIRSNRKEPEWPGITLTFAQLPPTWQEFEDQLRDKLETPHRVLVRRAVWKELVLEHNPNLTWQSLFSVSSTEMDRMYATIKNNSFRSQRAASTVLEINARGIEGPKFLTLFKERLATWEKELLSEIFRKDLPETDEVRKAQGERVIATRRTIALQVFDDLLRKMSGAVSSGRLQVTHRIRELEFDGLKEIPQEPDFESRLAQAVALPYFGSVALFPLIEGHAPRGGDSVAVMFDQRAIEAVLIPIEDPRVQRLLRAKLQAKAQAHTFRELAYLLFGENLLKIEPGFCVATAFPCVDPRPHLLAEAMFPETYYTGFSNVGSTLLEPSALDRVLSIGMEDFNRVYSVPNPFVPPGK